MHKSVMEWVESVVESYQLRELKTLEVGSRNVNGSPRKFFAGPYIGVDMMEGPDVDVLANAHHLPFPDESFGVVITTEMLEHDSHFWLTMAEMARVLRRGGYLIMTARGIGFRYHEYPSDYWRFTEDAFRQLIGDAGLTVLEVKADPSENHPGVFGLAMKV